LAPWRKSGKKRWPFNRKFIKGVLYMRSLEVIESDLAAAREALLEAKGTPAEVYSRIVGYYRSVRNWNRGKREEYGERVSFDPDSALLSACVPRSMTEAPQSEAAEEAFRILLFVRPACPACPSAKTAAGKLGIPVDLYDADTDEGFAEAVKRNVMSTPTAILLSGTGEELGRARAADEIGRLAAGQRIAV
jgi:ribonucleoside-triphosphate reductase